MATGSGPKLGDALGDLFGQGGRTGGHRSTYDRSGWRAQFAQLSATKSGYVALERAGLEVSTRAQRGWLSGDSVASRANQGLIAQAYAAMAGGWNPRWETAQFSITGRVTQGGDSRERGKRGNSPLRIDGRSGEWDPIKAAWDAGADLEVIGDLFITHVVVPDLGEGSDPWEFDGDWYQVNA